MKPKKCPCCEQDFICQVHTIHSCACSTITLSEQARKYIADRFLDCICIDCLQAISQELTLDSLPAPLKHFSKK